MPRNKSGTITIKFQLVPRKFAPVFFFFFNSKKTHSAQRNLIGWNHFDELKSPLTGQTDDDGMHRELNSVHLLEIQSNTLSHFNYRRLSLIERMGLKANWKTVRKLIPLQPG